MHFPDEKTKVQKREGTSHGSRGKWYLWSHSPGFLTLKLVLSQLILRLINDTFMEEMSRVLNNNQKRNQKIKEDQNVKLSNVVLFPFMDTY